MSDCEWKNKLYFGDNLNILREHIPDKNVDLIYLDPPFNSKATYNVLFSEKNGTESAAQITAFEDTWHWGMESEAAYHEVVTRGGKIADLLGALRLFLGTNDMMAYLTMMAIRLKELYRVLRPTGSIYLHCDPTASHHLKLVMDAIFGPENFRNEIVWCYKSRPQSKHCFGKKHDTLLFYTVSDTYIFNWQAVVRPLAEVTVKKYKLIDADGRRYRLQGRGITGSPIRSAKDVDPKWEKTHPELVIRDYLDEKIGVALEDWWVDINILNQVATERLGYPTQKPEALLDRIIRASSHEGDIVLDPFCGCGTTLSVAERLHRRWIGIDVTHLAVTLMQHRLHDSFGADLSPYEVFGDPKDLTSARALAEENRYQFEWWTLGLVGAQPAQDKKKGADKGVDGLIYFIDNTEGKLKKILVQVKSGHVTRPQVSDLCHAVDRENAAIGLFITLKKPTRPMIEEAATAGFYEAKELGKKYPRLQILTIEELFSGKQVKYPRGAGRLTYKQAQRRRKQAKAQPSLLDGLID